MEALILNKYFEVIAIADSFKTFIWTDRYDKCGDFTLEMQGAFDVLTTFKEDYYIYLKDSEHMMIIEDAEIITDVENGNTIKITGRSLESMLDRRIVWNQTVINGSLQDAVKKLLDENIISPTIAERKIDNFIFEASTDTNITNLSLEAQFMGDSLYDVIVAICETFSIGFKITLNEENKFVFKLYAGADRSYAQESNPHVIFSPNFENIIDTNYIQSKKMLKTVALVRGEGEGKNMKTAIAEVESGAGAGLDRRELYTDARDISTYVGDETISDSEYKAQLKQRGKEYLAENVYISSFEGEVETTRTFIYGKDFYMGDIVQIANEYGLESRSRISELIRSQNTEGYNVYPTFSAIL